ncbi:3773_t:CDS:10 [Diversispora eburnea]|uniref:3773_t:CDS:1 n=1 Tax=Diversispora eburnea TaxID=1213867 RepID=A0A9N8ZL15_9GLOM|nr:3773_t:CDS:10 [Diversispora eburnea]
MGSNSYLVVGLLEKMDSSDTDFRYMATNDLMNELQKDGFTLEESTEKRVVHKVLKLMDDPNGEVQNLAVKCLAPLVKKIREAQLGEIVDKLCDYATQKNKEELRDIAGIGLKTVIVEIPSNSPSAGNVMQKLIPKLLDQLGNINATYEVQMDTLDILSELLARFGSSVANNVIAQKKIQNCLINNLNHSRPAFRKRTTVALGNLVTHTPDDLFNELVHKLLEGAPRLGKYLPQFLPLVINSININDDELRENCLQTLESFVLRCPTEMTPNIDDIINICLVYLKYDPNYANDEMEDDGDAEMDEDEEMATEEEEEDDDDDEGCEYLDLLRRSSSKLLAAIIGTRHELLTQLYHSVSPALVNRFKEREESVRVDVLQTFIVLLRQTHVYGGESYIPRDNDHEPKRRRAVGPSESQESPKQMLRQLVPKLSRNLSKQLVSKSIITKQTGFLLLRELVTVLNGGLDNHLNTFVPPIENSLSVSPDSVHHHHTSTNSNLKIETLSFLRQLFKVHPPQVFHNYLSRLCPPIINSVRDKFYKITSEAFLVCIELIKVIRPIEYQESTQTYNIQPLNPEFKQYILDIYDVTMARLSTMDADQEVKERSIMCLGVLISQTGDNLQEQLKTCMPLLLERLRNEVTRLTTVKTFKMIADSTVCESEEVRLAIKGAIQDVAVLLRKSHRQLKVATLVCLEVFVRRYGLLLGPENYSRVIEELTPHISDQDLHLLPLALNTVVSILYTNPASLPTVYSDIMPNVFKLVQSTLVQGAALDSLLVLFQTLIKTQESDFNKLFSGLIQPCQPIPTIQNNSNQDITQLILSKQAYSTIAQCIATICVASTLYCNNTVIELNKMIGEQKYPDSIKYVSLLTLGEIGRKIDLSSHSTIHVTILSMFSSQSEDLKSAAAFALGNVSSGNVSKYLPIVIQEITSDPKKRYLLLHSLKEIISRYSNEDGVKALGPFADDICGENIEEGTRGVVAECLGKLTLANPNKFLPELQKRLRSGSAQTRGTVVTAIKFTFINQGQEYDALLRPLIVDFLSLIQDSDLNVRRLSLSTLNSAAHNKPYLIRDVLDQLLPLLYSETEIKDNLIHMVEMGPFKHKVDDGLDIRKSAYETMYTLLETCLDRLEIYNFLSRVISGLSDQHDICILSHTMLIRLAHVAPTAVSQRLDETVEPLKATLTYRMKDNAVKSEIDKNNELCRSAVRTVVALNKLSEQGGSTPKFDAFVRDTKVGQWGDQFNAYQAEMENKESGSGHVGDSYTPVPTAEPSDIANLPKFTYNLINEAKTTRDNIRSQNINYCVTTCGGASNNFLNVTTMGWGCGCSLKTPDFKFYEWPINIEDCRNRGLACAAACQSDTTPVEKKSECNIACSKVYAMQCGTANQVQYHYEVETEADIPSYSSENDPGNPSASSSTTSSPTETSVGSDSPSGASIQNPIIWAISALAIVAAGMMTL